MTLPYQAVLRWRPDALSEAADRLRRHVRALEAQADRVLAARRSTAGHWHGEAADAAQHRLRRAVTTGEDLVLSLESARTRLSGVAETLGQAQSRVRSLVDDAEASAFRLTPDGTVHPPYLPPPGLEPTSMGATADYASSFEARADRLLDEAAERTRELRAALLEAQLADRHQAATLRSLDLPPVLLGEMLRIGQVLPSVWAVSTDAVVFPEGWEPWPAMSRGSDSEWVREVLRGPCLPGAATGEDDDPDDNGTGYYGGGFVAGPDGNRYPLVVPQVAGGGLFRSDGGWQTTRVRDLLGRDHGWHRIGATYAIARFGSRTARAERVLVGAATFFGMQTGPGTGYRRRNDLLPHVAVDSLGAPRLLEHPTALATPSGMPAEDLTLGSPDPPGVSRLRAEQVGGALTLVGNAAAAAALVEHLDDHLTHAYSLNLQQNEDGRRRALLDLYDVYQTPDERVVVRRSSGYVGADGTLRLAQDNPRYSHDVVNPGPG